MAKVRKAEKDLHQVYFDKAGPLDSFRKELG